MYNAKLVFLSLLFLLGSLVVRPCSSYKITLAGTTMYGMNYDTWFTSPRIWFETTGYGAMFTGANFQGGHDLTPQAGLNEYGLAFGTLATPTPPKTKSLIAKKPITSRSSYLKSILHNCKNVMEVKNYIDQYDHSTFLNDVFFYIDAAGQYLIVEPYTLTVGNDPKYVIANFCPSTITDYSTIKQTRYINGVTFLKTKIDTSLAFCTALSDTMHVCRQKKGDGTLLTSIWNLNRKIVHIYFYHDYTKAISFNLSEELAKGDHYYDIVKKFPPNAEYQQLLAYKTPSNSKFIERLLCILAGLFMISSPYFLISYFRNRNSKFARYKLLLSFLSLCLFYYMYCLLTVMNIYYFPAPYQHYKFGIISLASYLPYLILILVAPLLILNKKVLATNAWQRLASLLFVANNLAYLLLIGLFFYWGLLFF